MLAPSSVELPAILRLALLEVYGLLLSGSLAILKGRMPTELLLK